MGDRLAGGPTSGAPEAVLSPRGGCRVLGGREGLTARVSGTPLSGLTQRSSLEGLAGGERMGRGDGRGAGRGLAQVLLVALDGLLDAQKHGGEPLVQPGDGVVLLHRLGVAVHILFLVGF